MNIEDLQKLVLDFRDKRDWKQFHNPKDVSLSLTLEASELLEHFQWKNGDELKKYLKTNKSAVADELADVLYYSLLLANELGIDMSQALIRKIKKNELKYPVKKSKGSSKKYTEL